MQEDELTIKQLEKLTKSRKKSVNPKAKGKRGEAWFAEKLSKLTGQHFHRIYTSGASVGKKNADNLEKLTQAQGEAQLGDIQSPEDFRHYFIWEIKNYTNIKIHKVFSKDFPKQINDWIDELEYDLESANIRMKNNHRFVIGFLCMKMTRKGAWVIGNKDYIEKVINKKLCFDNYLSFKKEPLKILKDLGYGNEYFMTDFMDFMSNNKTFLFQIDVDKQKKLEELREKFKKIVHS